MPFEANQLKAARIQVQGKDATSVMKRIALARPNPWNIMQTAFRLQNKECRLSAVQLDCVISLTRSMCLMIQGHVEDTAGGSVWRECDHLALNVLESRNSRCRRIPTGYKRALSAETSSGHKVRDMRSLVLSKGVWDNKRRMLTDRAASSSKDPTNFIRVKMDTMLQYRAAGMLVMRNAKHKSLVLDGLNTGGYEMLYLGLWSQEREQGTWCAPQAARRPNTMSKTMCLLSSRWFSGLLRTKKHSWALADCKEGSNEIPRKRVCFGFPFDLC